MFSNNFVNKHLRNCNWSKEPKKRYNQLKHFESNCNKYDIGISDLIIITESKKDIYKKYIKR